MDLPRLAPPVFEGDEEKTRIARLLNVTLLSLAVIGFLASGLGSLTGEGSPIVLIAVAVVALLLLVLRAIARRGHVRLASILVTLLIFALSGGAVYAVGTIRAPIVSIYFLCVTVAGLFLGIRGIIVFTSLSLPALLGLLWAETSGLLPPVAHGPAGLTQWITWAAILVAVALFFGAAIHSLNEALDRANRYATELEDQQAHLTEMVEERTRDLERRTRYLEAATTIARDIASELTLDALLERVVQAISGRFGFYHAGIFLLDPSGEWAELQAASSEGGRRMIERGHRLHVGSEGIVGYVIAQGHPRVVMDVGEDTVYFDNPDLPDTRSEIALPLRARGEIIGVLDVQSREPAAFGPDDVTALQTLADQVALAISNARLFRQVKESLETERRAFGELSRQAWQYLLQVQTDLGFLSDARGTVPAGDLWEPQMETAVRSGRVAPQHGTVAVPIKVRGQVIGVVDGRKPEGTGAWTSKEIDLLQALTSRLGVALESARLYQETRRRAVQEQLLGEIAARMRESLDLETVLRTAAEELFQTLEAERVVVRLTQESVGLQPDETPVATAD